MILSHSILLACSDVKHQQVGELKHLLYEANHKYEETLDVNHSLRELLEERTKEVSEARDQSEGTNRCIDCTR